MKKIHSALTVITMLLLLASCGNPMVEKLKKEVETVNGRCPLKFGDIGQITSVTYDEDKNCVDWTVCYASDFMLVDYLKTNKGLLKELVGLSFQTEESKRVLEDIINAGASTAIIYKVKGQKDTVTILFTKDELKDLVALSMSEDVRAARMLELSVMTTNASCPQRVDEVTVMTGVALDSDNLTYLYEISDRELFNDIMRLNSADRLEVTEEMKSEMKHNLRNPVMAQWTKLLTKTGRGVVYRYICPGEKGEFTVTFSTYELKNL